MSDSDQGREHARRHAGWRRHRLTARRLIAMGFAAAGLYLLTQGFLSSSCWFLFFLVSLVAWPIWEYQKEYALFRRRAVLSSVTPVESRARAWLWAGHFTKAVQVVVCMGWAVLLLALATQLEPEHWFVLGLDVLFLAVIINPVSRRVASEVKDGQVNMIARRWPLFLINGAALTVAFLVIDFFVVGAPDTREMAWYEVAESAFGEVGGNAACAMAGLCAGGLAAVQQLAWHASERVIPNLPTTAIKLVTWSIVLLQAGAIAYFYTRLQLGVNVLLDKKEAARLRLMGETTISKAFVWTILLLALPYFYATFKLAGVDTSALAEGARRVVEWSNPCKPDDAGRRRLATELDQALGQARQAASQHAEQRVDGELDGIFAGLEPGVDAYLDWYFTVLGEYQRLVALVAGDFADVMGAQLEKHLFDATGFADELHALNESVARESEQHLLAAAASMREQVDGAVRNDPCGLGDIDLALLADLDRDKLRVSAAAGGGVVASLVTTKVLTKKTAAAVAAKVAAKKAFASGAVVAGKVAAKKGGSSLVAAAGAAALCSPGGFLAVVCGVAVGVVTWFTADKILVEVDEARFRDEMRAEILTTLAEQKAILAEDLKANQQAVIDAMVLRIDDRMEKAFIPARDGI